MTFAQMRAQWFLKRVIVFSMLLATDIRLAAAYEVWLTNHSDTGADVCFRIKDGIGSKQNGHRYRRDGCCGRESRTLQGTGIHQE
jgi:hypothetical protein